MLAIWISIHFCEILVLHEKGLHINTYIFHIAANMQTNMFSVKTVSCGTTKHTAIHTVSVNEIKLMCFNVILNKFMTNNLNQVKIIRNI